MGARIDLFTIAVYRRWPQSSSPIPGSLLSVHKNTFLRPKEYICDHDTNVPGTLPGVPPHSLLEAVPEALWVDLVFVRAHARFFDYPRPRAPTQSVRERLVSAGPR